MAKYIDTHVHFYDEAFLGEEDAAIARSIEAGVGIMIQPDVDSKERDRMIEISQRYPGTLHTMLGLYPGSVDENWEKEVEMYMERMSIRPVAIGEIGLDYHYSADSAELQKKALREQFRIASELDLPVNIHLRDATDDFFKVLEDCRHMGLRGNLHAFSGSYETFCRIQRYGDWSVGIGGVLTFKKSKLAEVVRQIPLDRILLETDAPYLTPVPHRGERNESTYIPLIAAKIAELKQIDLEEVAQVTTDNATRLFRLK